MKKYKQKPSIVLSEETKKRLDDLGRKKDTYEDIICRLLDLRETK